MNEKIDILMATYNGEKFVSKQIESILSQTYSNFRLIICDDCSSDNTINILKDYEKKDNRIVIYKNEKNLGYVKNFEKLLGLVEYKYFMLSDQDDVWNSNKIQDTLNFLKEKSADLVFTDLEVVDENLNLKNKSFNKLMKYRKKILKTEGYNTIYLYNVITGCTILARSKFIDKILPIPVSKDLIHDHYIPLAITLCGGKIEYLDLPTLKYRQHSTNQVGTDRYTSKLNSFNEVRKHLIDVKISIFSEYIKLDKLFCENLKSENKIALSYFNSLKGIKNASLKNVGIYFRLYKFERLSYKLLYLFIFHFPGICKVIYKLIRKFIKRR